MVATLGIVNVSADDNDPGIPSYGDSKILVTRSTEPTYNGKEQTVFTLKCTNRDGSTENATCHYKYAVSTESTPREVGKTYDKDLDWKTSDSSYKDKDIEVKARDAGTYYLHLAMFKTDGSDGIQQYNVYGYNDGQSSMTVEIAKASAPTVNITAPTSAYHNAENDTDTYFVTAESEVVTLPFSKSTDNGIDTKWDDAKIYMNGEDNTEYSGSDISFSKDNGKLTIKANGADEIPYGYKVVLSAKSDNSNYAEGTATKTIYINKEKSSNLTVKFDELSTDDSGNVIYGLTGNEILEKIESVVIAGEGESEDFTLAPVEGVTTITNKKIEKLISNNEYKELTEDELKDKLNVNGNYRVSVTVTHKYGSGVNDTYTYAAVNNFTVVKKDADGTNGVTAKKNLVYKGTEQNLVTVTKNKLEPTDAKVEGYKVVAKGDSTVETGSITKEAYEAIEEPAATTAKKTDAGTYYVYYKVNHNTNGNYNDGYGVLEATIKPKAVTADGMTVTKPEDTTYNGTTQKQEPIVKDGEKVLTKDTDYTLSYSEDTTNAGEVTVTITGKDNYTGTRTAIICLQRRFGIVSLIRIVF